MTTMLQEPRPVDAPAPAPASPPPPTADDVRRGELAAFLRSRRERVSPEQAGLPRGPRRRTPGLRREEVAHLAAVGVTWYTWLEPYTPWDTPRIRYAHAQKSRLISSQTGLLRR
ncbi:hypothetical protein AB0901_32585, partial [Streptomyces roseifaciens]